MSRVENETWECLKKCLENKMSWVINEPTDGLRKTSLENKMARCDR
jgi:hypothetical protein